MKLIAHIYQQFDADRNREIPAENFGGWRTTQIEIAPQHTALVVMHAWDFSRAESCPGWLRVVEYILGRDTFAKRCFRTCSQQPALPR